MHSERDEVERPFIDQLVAMGWTHLPYGAPGEFVPGSAESGRESFAEVVLRGRFRDAIRKINIGPDSQPWLDEERLRAIEDRALDEPGHGVPANITFTELLTGSELTVEGRPDWDHGVRQPIKLVDWDHPERNDLLVVSQFRIDTPENQRAYVVLDLVLFVNGLPLVVIECKKPGPAAVDEAIDQLLGYAGAGRNSAVSDLTRFVQILVATDRESAQYGTITSSPQHFAPWRLEDGNTETLLRTALGKPADQLLHAQEILAFGMLRPTTLFELVRDFTVSLGSGTRTAKIVARWQQHRAVRRIVHQLRDRQHAIATGATPNHKGGVTWHTQGSGKSLTMSFLVRVLRRNPELRGFKVVVVTDRLDLEDQIVATLGSTGQTPRRATTVSSAHDHLARETPDLVVVTIQKSQRDEDADDGTDEALGATLADTRVHVRLANAGTDIVILVDEAHRSQESKLHARLRAKLPNAVLIGFTGTPILRGRKKTTEEIFGPILDIYALKDAERDKAIVPLKYESREIPADVVDRAVLDAGFLATVPSDGAERAAVVRQFARHREVLESKSLIEAKAEDMFRHWVRHVLPDRFSAQVVAESRLAAVRYRDALLEARGRIIADLQGLPDSARHDPMAWADADENTQLLLTALQHRDLLERLTAVTVISAGKTPPGADWTEWTDKDRQSDHIARFKQGLGKALLDDPDPGWSGQCGELRHRHPIHDSSGDPWGGEPALDEPARAHLSSNEAQPAEPIAFIVVKSMLLTGFDAPVEQVLYIDRQMKSVELLQAIARPNRPREYKEFGLIVDYVAIAPELAQALSDYDPDHLEQVVGDANPNSILASLDEVAVPWLRDRHQAVVNLLAEHGITSLHTPAEREDLLALLDDPELRAAFDDATRSFLSALNSVLPRPQALEFEDAARQLGLVQYLARRRYRDSRTEFSPYRYGAKIRQLIDTHIRAEGVIQRIPPVEISASDFAEKVGALPDDRARALEMKHALHEHVSARIASDPVTYQRLSERLDAILQEMEQDQDFAQAYLELIGLREDVLTAEQAAAKHGLDRWTEQPIHSLLDRVIAKRPAPADQFTVDIVWVARDVAISISEAVNPTHFLYNGAVRERARKRLVLELVEKAHLYPDEARNTADELLELATRNREHFLRLARRSDP